MPSPQLHLRRIWQVYLKFNAANINQGHSVQQQSQHLQTLRESVGDRFYDIVSRVYEYWPILCEPFD